LKPLRFVTLKLDFLTLFLLFFLRFLRFFWELIRLDFVDLQFLDILELFLEKFNALEDSQTLFTIFGDLAVLKAFLLLHLKFFD
jgi:hypothetical protein